MDSTDDYGQKPIHLAAQSNKPEVVKLFLKQRPSLVSVTTKVGAQFFGIPFNAIISKPGLELMVT